MKFSLMAICLVVALVYQIESVLALDMDRNTIMQKTAKCMSPSFLHNTTFACRKKYYKLLHDDPSINCSVSVLTTVPSCMNVSTVDCMADALGINISMIPAEMIPGPGHFNADAKFFCEDIVPSLSTIINNCSLAFDIEQTSCSTTFQRKFKANRADPDLCNDYTVQMDCIKRAMNADCEASKVESTMAQLPYLFAKEGNPFCYEEDGDGGNNGSKLMGQSILIALCLLIINISV